jgi:tetratricopeptide (TPR) repeat protein
VILAVLAATLLLTVQQPADEPRDPRALPVAEAGRWDGWSPRDPVPDEHRARMGEAMTAYGARDYQRALAQLFELLESQPDFPPALYQASTASFRLRRYGDCIELLERFLRVVPHEVGATQALGHSLYSLGRYEEARAHYARVLAKNPGSVEAVRGYALAHLRLGELETALELLNRVLELRPGHAEAQAWIAHVLYELERLPQARVAAERARDLAPHEPRPWFLLSRILAEQGQDDAALAAQARFEELSRVVQEVRSLEGVLLHDPSHAGALRRLVELRSRSRDPAVRRDLALLVQLLPADCEVRRLALDTLVEIGDGEGARIAALELERICGERAETWERLRAYYASVGDRVRQVQAGERHLRLLDKEKKQ